VNINHPSVIDDDVQLDLHPRAEPQLLSSPRFFLQCWRASPPGLAVVCGSGYGYRRPDGIAVVPVGALGP
jgi:hypothetical protein